MKAGDVINTLDPDTRQTQPGEAAAADRFVLRILIPVFLAVALAYSVCIPDWQHSDEPFHYFYIRALAQEHRLPTHEETYEAAHPPLYYAAAAVWGLPFWSRPSGVLLNWLRLLSVILGALSLYYIYRIGRDALEDPWLGAGMAAFAAVNPMFTATVAVVNNDAAVILASCATIYLMLKTTRNGGGFKAMVLCGAAAGVCCLIKLTANLLPVFFCLYYLFRPGAKSRGLLHTGAELAVFSATFFAVCSWWFVLGYLRIGDKVLFNPVVALHPNPLYIPAHFAWFAKVNMLNFWMPIDHLRGFPRNVPFLLKAFYFGLSAAGILSMGICLARAALAPGGRIRHILLSFGAALLVFLLQMHLLNMQYPLASPRYSFIIMAAMAALVLVPVRRAAGGRFPALVAGALAAGVVLHLVWAFALLLPLQGPAFNL